MQTTWEDPIIGDTHRAVAAGRASHRAQEILAILEKTQQYVTLMANYNQCHVPTGVCRLAVRFVRLLVLHETAWMKRTGSFGSSGQL